MPFCSPSESLSGSLWPCGRQHARPPCPSPAPGACSDSCPTSQWCQASISSSVTPFSPPPCPQVYFVSASLFLPCKEVLVSRFYQLSSVLLLSHVWLFATPWIAARQASLSITSSGSLLKLMSIESVMPSSHLVFCHMHYYVFVFLFLTYFTL